MQLAYAGQLRKSGIYGTKLEVYHVSRAQSRLYELAVHHAEEQGVEL